LIVNLPHSAAIGIFDGRHPWNSDLPVKLRRIGQDYG